MVYSIYSLPERLHLDPGVTAVYAATSPENIFKTLDVVGAQFRRIKQAIWGICRWDEVKALIRGNLLLARESTENCMSSIAKNELYYERDVPIDEVLRKINAVSAEAVIELARTIREREDDLGLIGQGPSR